MIFKKNNGEEAKYENLNGLFDTTRDNRNDLFGSYLAEGEINAEEVQKKVDGKIKTYEYKLLKFGFIEKTTPPELLEEIFREPTQEEIAQMELEEYLNDQR